MNYTVSDYKLIALAGQTIPDPPPPNPEPDPPLTFTHGDEIFRWNVGFPNGYYPEDTRTPIANPIDQPATNFSSANNGLVIENVRFTGKVKIDGAATITFRYCIFDPPASDSSGQYGFQLINGGTAIVEDSTFIGKFSRGKTIYLTGTGGLWLKRCLVQGSQDVVHCTADGTTQTWPTYEAVNFTGARFIAEDCWFGDAVRGPGGHVDNFQWDNQGGNAVLKRCKLLCYSVVLPDLPPEHEGNPLDIGNFAVGLTYGSTPGVLKKFSLESCRFDGGNNTLGVSGDGGADVPELMAIHNCHWGTDEPFLFESNTYVGIYRYNPILGGTHFSNNTWAVTGNVLRVGVAGSTPTVVAVTSGQAVAGA